MSQDILIDPFSAIFSEFRKDEISFRVHKLPLLTSHYPLAILIVTYVFILIIGKKYLCDNFQVLN